MVFLRGQKLDVYFNGTLKGVGDDVGAGGVVLVVIRAAAVFKSAVGGGNRPALAIGGILRLQRIEVEDGGLSE